VNAYLKSATSLVVFRDIFSRERITLSAKYCQCGRIELIKMMLYIGTVIVECAGQVDY